MFESGTKHHVYYYLLGCILIRLIFIVLYKYTEMQFASNQKAQGVNKVQMRLHYLQICEFTVDACDSYLYKYEIYTN